MIQKRLIELFKPSVRSRSRPNWPKSARDFLSCPKICGSATLLVRNYCQIESQFKKTYKKEHKQNILPALSELPEAGRGKTKHPVLWKGCGNRVR